tara:strand:- start:91 stop:921 length:831 start_codon:yes stop_codon:yes gene_type:complete
MKKIYLIFFLVILESCSEPKKEITKIQEIDLDSQMTEVLKDAYKTLKDGDALYAAKKFNEVEKIYPQSAWATKSILLSAYAYYSQDYYDDAIFHLERFIKKYPDHKDVDYAYFLLATCFYENIVDESKDLRPLLVAKKNFKYLLNNFPETDYALDAKFKVQLIDDVLAAKEIYIAKYYLKKGKWIAAINRFKIVLNEYDTTIYTPEALHRLVEVYYKNGLIDESKKYASLLGYNYGSNKWYEETYKIFNNDYEYQLNKKLKKKKISLFDKFKVLFK